VALVHIHHLQYPYLSVYIMKCILKRKMNQNLYFLLKRAVIFHAREKQNASRRNKSDTRRTRFSKPSILVNHRADTANKKLRPVIFYSTSLRTQTRCFDTLSKQRHPAAHGCAHQYMHDEKPQASRLLESDMDVGF
ncbi:MAG: hypothetical protein K6G80_09275, partial [Treponema sp.]|nr:hypothetical protein [Treponema sp.]